VQDEFKRVILVLPYPAQDLLGIFFIYVLIDRQPENGNCLSPVDHCEYFAAVLFFHSSQF